MGSSKIVVSIVKAGYGKRIVRAIDTLGFHSLIVKGEGSIDPMLPMFFVGLTTNAKRDVVFSFVDECHVEAVQKKSVFLGKLTKKHKGFSFVVDVDEMVGNSDVRKEGFDG